MHNFLIRNLKQFTFKFFQRKLLLVYHISIFYFYEKVIFDKKYNQINVKWVPLHVKSSREKGKFEDSNCFSHLNH